MAQRRLCSRVVCISHTSLYIKSMYSYAPSQHATEHVRGQVRECPESVVYDMYISYNL